MAPRRNVAGWVRTKKGEWVSPLVEVDGEWVPNPDLDLDEEPRRPSPPPPPSPAAQARAKVERRQAAVQALRHLKPMDEIVAHGVRVVLLDPIRIEPDLGFVEAQIMAFPEGSNDLLNVDDGRWHFDDPPQDPEEFLDLLALAVARHNAGGA